MKDFVTPPEAPLRPPSEVMRLSRMGQMFPTRLSFLRILTRLLADHGAGPDITTWDMDGDGYPDVAIGALGDDDGGIEAGAIYLIDGPSLSDMELGDAPAKLIGEVSGDEDCLTLNIYAPANHTGAALPVLADWATAVGMTYKGKLKKDTDRLDRREQMNDWGDVVKEIERLEMHLGTDRETDKLDALEAVLAESTGRFPAEVLTELRDLRADSPDEDELAAFLGDIPNRPAQWLAREYFAW